MKVARDIVNHALRIRYATYLAITSAFTILFIYVTVRFALNDGDLIGVAISSLITIALGVQARRWYRRLTGYAPPDPR